MIDVSLSKTELLSLLERQLNSFFPFTETESVVVEQQLPAVLDVWTPAFPAGLMAIWEPVGGG